MSDADLDDNVFGFYLGLSWFSAYFMFGVYGVYWVKTNISQYKRYLIMHP